VYIICQPATKKNQYKNSMDYGENPVMKTEKWHDKDFKCPSGILAGNEKHFYNVIKTDNYILYPEKQEKIESVLV